MPELPGNGLPEPQWAIHSTTLNWTGGILVEFDTIETKTWLVMFAWDAPPGPKRTDQIYGVFAHPDPNLLLVISGANGYIVEPSQKSSIPLRDVWPIRHVNRIPDRPNIVIADYSSVSRLGPDGTYWHVE